MQDKAKPLKYIIFSLTDFRVIPVIRWNFLRPKKKKKKLEQAKVYGVCPDFLLSKCVH